MSNVILPLVTVECKQCKTTWETKELILKMGGLLCPDCRVILVWPGDLIYKQENDSRVEETKGKRTKIDE